MPVAGHGHVLHWCPDGFTIVTPSGLSRGNIHDHGPATITLAWMGFQVPIPSSSPVKNGLGSTFGDTFTALPAASKTKYYQ